MPNYFKSGQKCKYFIKNTNFGEVLLLSGLSLTGTLNLVNLINRVFYFHLSDISTLSCL